MNHDDPVALYIITQPTDKSRLRPLIGYCYDDPACPGHKQGLKEAAS
jgi:hypothetical protein